MNDLINLHIKNKYYIDIKKQNRGCIVSTPANILSKPQHLAEITNYVIDNNILSINNEDFIVPNYAARITIFADILMKMTKLNMTKELLLFFDGIEQKKSLLEILSPPANDEDYKKDKFMFQNISRIVFGEYDRINAEEDGIEEGFNLIYDIFAKGGI